MARVVGLSQGPSLRRRYPASSVPWPAPTPKQTVVPTNDVQVRNSRPLRASPNDPDHLPNMPCSLPRWTEPVLVSVASRLVLPSPFPWRVGVHNFAFEACSSFTRVTACRVARLPYRGLCHEASTRPVSPSSRSLATMFTDNYMGGSSPPLVICALGAHKEILG